MERKIIQIGSSAAVTIPPRLLEVLGLSVGDTVTLDDKSDKGFVSIRPSKTSTDRSKKITSLTLDFVERYRDDLEALAK